MSPRTIVLQRVQSLIGEARSGHISRPALRRTSIAQSFEWTVHLVGKRQRSIGSPSGSADVGLKSRTSELPGIEQVVPMSPAAFRIGSSVVVTRLNLHIRHKALQSAIASRFARTRSFHLRSRTRSSCRDSKQKKVLCLALFQVSPSDPLNTVQPLLQDVVGRGMKSALSHRRSLFSVTPSGRRTSPRMVLNFVRYVSPSSVYTTSPSRIVPSDASETFFARRPPKRFRYRSGGGMCPGLDVQSYSGCADHPTWRERNHPPGLRTAYFQAIKVGFSAVSVASCSIPQFGDFAVHGCGHFGLSALDLTPRLRGMLR